MRFRVLANKHTTAHSRASREREKHGEHGGRQKESTSEIYFYIYNVCFINMLWAFSFYNGGILIDESAGFRNK